MTSTVATLHDHDVAELVNAVTQTMLSRTASLVGTDAAPPPGERTLTAVVQISGQTRGAVAVHVPDGFARVVAAAMFAIEPASATVADLQDAIGELGNMIGGNLKALMPGPSRLSLPAVVEGGDYSLRIPRCSPWGSYAFDCGEGHPVMLVRVWRLDEQDGASE